jgi:hypothetical protein
VVTNRLSRRPEEYTVRTAAARVAQQLASNGVELHPGERLNFLLVPGPEKALAWETIEGAIPYDRAAYTELLLRAVDSVLAPLGIDRVTLETWLLGNVGYWGPPGMLPPRGVDIGTPLLARRRLRTDVGIRAPSALDHPFRNVTPQIPDAYVLPVEGAVTPG